LREDQAQDGKDFGQHPVSTAVPVRWAGVN